MPERRMLIVDEELAKRIEENKGDMSIAEFIVKFNFIFSLIHFRIYQFSY